MIFETPLNGLLLDVIWWFVYSNLQIVLLLQKCFWFLVVFVIWLIHVDEDVKPKPYKTSFVKLSNRSQKSWYVSDILQYKNFNIMKKLHLKHFWSDDQHNTLLQVT